MQDQFLQAAGATTAAFDPTGLGGVVKTFSDPGKWAYILAVAGGGVIALVGLYFVLHATTGATIPVEAIAKLTAAA